MATAYAAGSALDMPPFISSAAGAHDHRLGIDDEPMHTEDSMLPQLSSPELSQRDNLPLPLPPFAFPARPSSSSAPSSFSRTTGRRAASAIDFSGFSMKDASGSTGPAALPSFSFNPGSTANPTPPTTRRARPAPLPTFSFNPGASGPADTSPDGPMAPSPGLSPPSPRMPPARQGHRRGGSEFVGGHLKSGESITIMTTSPTQGESGYASPTLAPTRPARGRGHAHRRSGAISQHDLTMILKPNNPGAAARGNSAPTSPAGLDTGYAFPASSDDTALGKPAEIKPAKPASTPSSPVETNTVPAPKPAPRTRVGFSDTLEFIPRPLSLVSNDTTSTVMGARPSHSVSSSISSIISMSNSTTTGRETPPILGSPSSNANSGSRPSTAGAVLERTPSFLINQDAPSPRRRNSIPVLSSIPPNETEPAEPSPTKTPKRWSFFGLDPFTATHSPTKNRPRSSSSSGSASKTTESPAFSEPEFTTKVDEPERPTEGVKNRGKKKKQKRVRSWTSSILTRKSKIRSHKSKPGRRRSLTPPVPSSYLNDLDDEDVEDPVGQMDLIEPPPFVSMNSPALGTPTEDDASTSMIDLDAALGPFNTPTARDPLWEEAQRAGAPPRRQLHSAAGMRNFVGPGMHYHRRAESAPALPPLEGRFGFHRFGSSSTMADVFEEDEEEDDGRGSEMLTDEAPTPDYELPTISRRGSAVSPDSSVSTPTQERDLGIISPRDSSLTLNSVKRKGSGSSLDLQPPGSRMRTDTATSSLHEEVIAEEVPGSQLLSQPCCSDTSESAAPSPRRMVGFKDMPPVETHAFHLPPPSLTSVSPYAMSQTSSFPSPRSPVSYDTQRISTAPSSIAEEHSFQSLLMGEPGPEVVRISVDVPSLTSSTSTTTRESTFVPGVRPRGMPFHDQRPASFTSTAFGRRRSSLASFSRLISSAHGERSKLSMEVPIDDDADKKPKVSKTKRLSRMMQFWKAREPTGP